MGKFWGDQKGKEDPVEPDSSPTPRRDMRGTLITNQPTVYFPQYNKNSNENITNSSRRLPEKPHGSMNNT